MEKLPKTITLEKRVGETPLQALDRLRASDERFADVKLAYAGRLDPMASGKLLVIVGDECAKYESYIGLDKAYDIEVLLGFATDTGDVLGIADYKIVYSIVYTKLQQALRDATGKVELPYPVYSSKPVQGKPLFMWALEGRLHEIEIPHTASNIYILTCSGERKIQKGVLYEQLLRKINSLPTVTEDSKALGKDFRRDDIRARWDAVFAREPDDAVYTVLTLQCTCSSGTYMRSLAAEIGASLGTKGLALSIHRSTIGTYRYIGKGLGFWTKRF